jgi:hypothetical protein
LPAAHFPQFFKNPQKNRKIPVTPVGILGLNNIEKTADKLARRR